MRDFGMPGPMADWNEVAYIPGAEMALRKLTKKFTCVIATSANHSGTEEMIAALKRVGANKYFHHFFSLKELGYQKPNPKFFSAITDKLGLDASMCVMIGNLYEKDIIGAKKVGMQTILFDEDRQKIDFPDADVVIHDMSDLIKIIS
jgi:putative hydrolase of the HAD superfamily